MFHKVVWQHMQGVVGCLIRTLLQIYQRILQWKKLWKSVKIWQNCGHEFVASLFWPTLYMWRINSVSVSLVQVISVQFKVKRQTINVLWRWSGAERRRRRPAAGIPTVHLCRDAPPAPWARLHHPSFTHEPGTARSWTGTDCSRHTTNWLCTVTLLIHVTDCCWVRRTLL